jgi:hypothetical protein
MFRSAAIGAMEFKWWPYVSACFRGLLHTLRANFRHLVQFSGTAKPGSFRKTHVVGILKCLESLQSEPQNSNDVPTFRAVFMGYSTRFRPILGNWSNFRELLNPMVFVKLMLLALWNVQRRCNRSHEIQMTSLRFGPFSWAIAHASGQYRHLG